MAIQRSWCRSLLVLIVGTLSMMGCGESTSHEASSGEDVSKSLFNQKCAICHGENGDQQFANAAQLTKSTLAFPEVVDRITKGKGAMPPQESLLSPEEIEILARYVMKFREKPVTP